MGQPVRRLLMIMAAAVAIVLGAGGSAHAAINDPNHPVPCDYARSISIQDTSYDEGDPTVGATEQIFQFQVVSTGCLKAGTVPFETVLVADGATANDLRVGSGQLTFASANGDVQTITVAVHRDGVAECPEPFNVRLGLPTGFIHVADAVATGRIGNDDGPYIPVRGHCGD
jgi:hypothetical protein